ncbi:dihydropteroate synthase [Terriglobus aquaticus]|uniref:Dihydropteroate synthase n=1 Tax=Terriglobus aquaticus TaxID=940139 RepID=A0ABW9KG06_9BACT|nr:dihydropteroate synthase [Terriglobus aquaticus]
MRPAFTWRLRSQALSLGTRTLVMGIVNVTPDSFSDGGAHASERDAIDHALRLLDDGADLLDIGGESTRPGSAAGTPAAIASAEEQRRVLPVIAGVLRARPDAIVSVDTYRSATARLAVESGAEIVNDVSGLLWDPDMARTIAELQCGAILMHTRGLPSEWQHQNAWPAEEVEPQVRSGLEKSLKEALAAGIERSRIVLDPGFGFGKRGAENWALLARLDRLTHLGCPFMTGLSRKGFLAPSVHASKRDAHTHAANTIAILNGAQLVRVHDVAGARIAADVADATLGAGAR